MTHWTVDSVDCQNKTIHAHLIKYGDITSIQAIRLYSITRLASIIHRLKRKGVNIRSEIQYNALNKSIHWAKYILVMLILSFTISCAPAINRAAPMVKKHNRTDFYGNRYHWNKLMKVTDRKAGFEANNPF